MEWTEVVGRRRMTRDFETTAVEDDVLLRMLDRARRVPSAGFSQGTDFVVLRGADTAQFWEHTLPVESRASFRWPGLLRAPLIVLPIADAPAYVERYNRPDKQASGLGAAEGAWPVPYWFIDTGMAAMVLLHAVVEEGLGALFFGIFNNEEALLASLGVPQGRRPIGAIAIGHPTAAERAQPSGHNSSFRPARRALDDVVHYGRW